MSVRPSIKAVAAFTLVIVAAVSFSSAQQQHKKRPGPFLIWGPVRIIRDERATFTNRNGEFIEGPRILSMTLTYNEDGTKQEQTSYAADGSISSRTAYLYDQDERVLETSSFNGKGELKSRIVSKYDSQENLVEEISYRSDGSISDRLTFVRRGDQRVIDSVSYDEHGVIRSKSTTTADQQTNRSESVYYDGDRIIQGQSATTTTPGGRTTTEQRTENTLREAFIADGRNGEEKIQFNQDGTIRTRERRTHEFDSYGNVIKTLRSIAKGDSSDYKPIDVTYRTIEYYGKDQGSRRSSLTARQSRE